MKHAFLVCAHNNFVLLKRLIKQLDYSDFDIYVHVDKKISDINLCEYENITEYSKVICIRNRINIRWGHVSQIRASLLLMSNALENGKYDYLHLLSGVDFPIKSNREINDFFKNNRGKEFVGFTKWTPAIDYKMGYYHLFSADQIRNSAFWSKINGFLMYLQNKLNIRHYHDTKVFSKGCNWWSITSNLARDVLSYKDDILSQYKFSLCADEIFMQTFVANNDVYKNNLFNREDENEGCQRLIDWNRGNPYIWKKDDFNNLVNSSYIFARKFDEKNIAIIDMIEKKLKESAGRSV